MASVTFAVDEELNDEISKFPWVNISELAREELVCEEGLKKQLEMFRKIVSKSKFTEADADEISAKVKEAMHKRLQERGL